MLNDRDSYVSLKVVGVGYTHEVQVSPLYFTALTAVLDGPYHRLRGILLANSNEGLRS